MNPGIEYYRHAGLPASGVITFLHTPVAGDTVTIDSVVYTFGTDFVGNDIIETAKSLASVVNADRNIVHFNPARQLNPFRSVYAIFYGNKVTIIASVPGTAGNSITLVSSTTKITVSAATLSGGVAPTVNLAAVTPTVVIKTVASSSTPEALGSAATTFQRVVFRGYKAARTQNSNTVWIQFAATDGAAGFDLEPGESQEFIAPDGKQFTAAQFYIDVATNNDGVTAFLF